MSIQLKAVIALSLIMAIGFATAAYFGSGFTEALLLHLMATALGLAVGLIVVNVYLQLDEKRQAAVPLLEMIAPSIRTLHNKHFIKAGRLAFGTPGWNALISAYQHNERNPEALSPQQRDALYEMVKASKSELLPLLESLHDQLRELSALLGWSFHPGGHAVGSRVSPQHHEVQEP